MELVVTVKLVSAFTDKGIKQNTHDVNEANKSDFFLGNISLTKICYVIALIIKRHFNHFTDYRAQIEVIKAPSYFAYLAFISMNVN